MKRDPATGERLYDVELYSDTGGQFIVEDLIENDAIWLLNAVGRDDEADRHEFVVGDLVGDGAAISFDGDRVIFAVIRD